MPALSVNRSSNVQFIGQQTLAKLPLINPPVGMKAPAIQNGTKKGTACSHWHEDIFTTELVRTGFECVTGHY